MRQKLFAYLLLAALLLSLSGCASLFDKEYLSAAPYEASEPLVNPEGTTEVRDFLNLRLAISSLVTAHEESATLGFRSYSGGSISDDLAAACKSVSADTVLGAYIVDYISYDLDRIVAYYEARVYIYYKRTAEEMDAIISTNTIAGLYDSVRTALAELSPGLVVLVGATDTGEDEVAARVTELYFEDPLSCMNRPTSTVEVYAGSGLQRIYEIRLDYGEARELLLERRDQLQESVRLLSERVTSEGEDYRALQTASLLLELCAADPAGGGTVWSALKEGRANSEGMALAYKVLCDAAGVDCMVVAGRLEQAEHYWNIISIDGDSYHVDVSRAQALGFGNVFLRSDADMWGTYWWDNGEYPSCAGELSYATLLEQTADPTPQLSEPPAESPEPTPSTEPSSSPAPEPSEPVEPTTY